MDCKPSLPQTSPDCTQIILMGEYGATVYGSRGDDTGRHPPHSASVQFGSSYSGIEDAAIPTCAGIILAVAAMLAMLMIRAGGRRR